MCRFIKYLMTALIMTSLLSLTGCTFGSEFKDISKLNIDNNDIDRKNIIEEGCNITETNNVQTKTFEDNSNITKDIEEDEYINEKKKLISYKINERSEENNTEEKYIGKNGSSTINSIESKKHEVKNNSNKVEKKDEKLINDYISYKINAKLDKDTKTIIGTEIVSFKNIYNKSLNEIVFNLFANTYKSKKTQDEMFKEENEEIARQNTSKKLGDFLGGIYIESVKIENSSKELEFIEKGQVLKVNLNNELKQNEKINLIIKYSVKLPFGIQSLSYYKDVFSGVNWYPNVAVYHESKDKWNDVNYNKSFESEHYDLSDYEVNLDVPKDFKVAITGVETESINEDRKIISVKNKNTKQIVFLSGENFKKFSKSKNGFKVNLYYLPTDKDKKKQIEKYVDIAFNEIDFLNDKFAKYPYGELDIVESYMQGATIGYPQVVQIGRISEESNPKKDSTFIHEIVNQWFHSIIGNSSEVEGTFLDKGLTDFATSYFENIFNSYEEGFQKLLITSGKPVSIAINSTDRKLNDLRDLAFNKRGRLLLYDIYKQVGENNFDNLMRQYFNTYKYKNTSIEGFLNVIEKAQGTELRNYVYNSLNKKDYDINDKYKLSENEKKQIEQKVLREKFTNTYKNENIPKSSFRKLVYKGILNEKIILVKPSYYSSKEEREFNDKITNEIYLKCKNLLGITINIINDKDIKLRDIENGNLIFIGNSKKNTTYKLLEEKSSTKIEKNEFICDKEIIDKSFYGAFILENPLNNKYLMLSIFYTDPNVSSNIIENISKNILNSKASTSSNNYEYMVFSKSDDILEGNFEKNKQSL